MNVLWMIALGGALGSVLRYGVTTVVVRAMGPAFPYGTLLVNVTGSFAIGLCYVWLMERTGAHPSLRPFLIVGILGGFTTFSSFSLETVALLMQGSFLRAAANVLASVALCLTATGAGIMLARAT